MAADSPPSPPAFTTLIGGDELERLLAAAPPACRVVDCRFDLADPDSGRRAFEAGHLPGAVYADLDRDLAGAKTGRNGRHPLPGRDGLAARLGDWGIDRSTQVVAYDAHGGSFAARLWWLLRWLGHERVAVLDGGFPAWIQAGRAVERQLVRPPARRFEPGPARERVVDAATVLAALGGRGALLLDARAPERFSGEVEPIDPVGGHIPGARNRFWQQNLADGRFKPAHVLRDDYLALLGSRPPAEAIAYCGSGVTACHDLLALAVAGLPGAALYGGAWSEWVADPARPIERGPSVQPTP